MLPYNMLPYLSSVAHFRCSSLLIGGPKMSGNFVRERQRIVYIYNIHVYYICKQTLPLAHEISRHFWAAYGLLFKVKYILVVSDDFILYVLRNTNSIFHVKCDDKRDHLAICIFT